MSNDKAITVSWTSVTPGLTPGGEILGYKLKVTNPNTAEEWFAFDGESLGLVDKT